MRRKKNKLKQDKTWRNWRRVAAVYVIVWWWKKEKLRWRQGRAGSQLSRRWKRFFADNSVTWGTIVYITCLADRLCAQLMFSPCDMIFLPNWKVNCTQGSSQRKTGKRLYSSRAVIVAPIGERSEQHTKVFFAVAHSFRSFRCYLGFLYDICCVSWTPDHRKLHFFVF